MAKLSIEEQKALMEGDVEENQEVEQEEEREEEQVETEVEDKPFDKSVAEMSEDEKLRFAMRQGFNPNWKAYREGDKKLTVDEFLKKYDTELPVVKETVKRMAQTQEQMIEAFNKQRELDKKRYERELEARIAEITEKKQKLEADGLYEKADFDKYNKLTKQQNEIELELKAPAEEKKAPEAMNPQMIEIKNTLEAWATNSSWYGKDIAATTLADNMSNSIREKFPNATIQERLNILEREVQRAYPHLFENQKRFSQTKVQGSERGSASASPSKVTKFGYNDLSKEDQRHLNIFKSMNWGLKKQPHEDNEQFAKRVQKAESDYYADMAQEYAASKK